MSKFNSNDHHIYYGGQESLRRNGVALIVDKKKPKCSTWVYLKNNRRISVCFQGKPLDIIVIQVNASTTNAKEAKELKLNGSMKVYKTF